MDFGFKQSDLDGKVTSLLCRRHYRHIHTLPLESRAETATPTWSNNFLPFQFWASCCGQTNSTTMLLQENGLFIVKAFLMEMKVVE